MVKKDIEMDNGNEKKDDNPKDLSGKENLSSVLYVLLVVVYVIANVMVTSAARSQSGLRFFAMDIPVSTFAGVFSSVANICVIFMTVYFKKRGFITALILLVLQFPLLLVSMITLHSPASLPGCFTNLLTIIAVILIYKRNEKIERFQKIQVENLKSQQRFSQRLFEQTATALVNAIDAKDTYSHGHSLRVAEYSEKIARKLGKDEDECYRIYYAALLHDVGKIGIPNAIINKNGRLTTEEYETIKQHPVMGNQILSTINEYPYLSIGAHYHHERYDGKGYPSKMKGDDIPEIARIISVADAYDAMSSNRSYRAAIPQQIVREEIVKGSGTQFDPRFAKIMQKLIDEDVYYQMQEKRTVGELAGKNELICNEYRDEISEGIILIPLKTLIHMKVTRENKNDAKNRGASFILFDSLDGRFHDEEKTIRDLSYFEYCSIWMDGSFENKNARKIETEVKDNTTGQKAEKSDDKAEIYDIEAVKIKDHVMIIINDGKKTITDIIALPDSSRYVYLSLTGEHCHITDVTISKIEKWVSKDYIPRIAEKIVYTDGPEGDIPNLQVDGHRTEATKGILLKETAEISFHSMSLPIARLIWHCPYIVIFSSKNGEVRGEDYKEYSLLRLDGESFDTTGDSENTLVTSKDDNFKGWDEWKTLCKKGFDSVVSFERHGNMITTVTDNFGINMINTTEIKDGEKNIYIALSGDQVALTNIRIKTMT